MHIMYDRVHEVKSSVYLLKFDDKVRKFEYDIFNSILFVQQKHETTDTEANT